MKQKVFIMTMLVLGVFYANSWAKVVPYSNSSWFGLKKTYGLTDTNGFFDVKASRTIIPKDFFSKPSLANFRKLDLSGALRIGKGSRSCKIDLGLGCTKSKPVRLNYNGSVKCQWDKLKWWEQFDLVLKVDSQNIDVKYSGDYGVKLENVKLAEVSWNVGCLFRASPNGTPIFRAEAGTQLVVVDDKTYKTWAKVRAKKGNSFVEGFVNKRLVSLIKGAPGQDFYKKVSL